MITNEDLKFQIDFYNYPTLLSAVYVNKFNFTDKNGTTGWNTLLDTFDKDNLVGIVRATNSAGVIFYGGTPYTAYDFTSADIVGVTPDWTTGFKAMPDKLVTGNYTWDYKVRYNSPGTIVEVVSGVFKLSGVDLTTLIGATPDGIYLQIYNSGTTRNGVYLITAVSCVGSDSFVTIASPPSDWSIGGGTEKAGIVWSTTKSYNYNITPAVAELTASSDCRVSQATLEDNTTYDITDVNGNVITNNAAVKTLRADYPGAVLTAVTSTSSPLIFGYGTSYNAGAYIYTGTYLMSLNATTTYDLEDWTDYAGVDYPWFVLYANIIGSKKYDVVCDSCLCTCYVCMGNLYDQYTAAINARNSDKVSFYERLMTRLSFLMNIYSQGQLCGEELDSYCASIKELLKSTECCCPNDSTNTPTQVIPVAAPSTIYASAIPITFGTGASGLPASPVSGQVHIFTTTQSPYTAWDYYQYSGSAWALMGNSSPAPATVKNPLLSNVIADTGVALGAGTVDLLTYTLPQSTIAVDEIVKVTSLFDIASGFEGSVALSINAQAIHTESIIASADTKILITATITNTANTTSFIDYEVKYFGTPDSSITNFKTLGSLNWTQIAGQIIKAARTSAVNPNSCIQKYHKIERIIK